MDREIRHHGRHAYAVVAELLHQLAGETRAKVEERGRQRAVIEQECAPTLLDAALERGDRIAALRGVGLEVGVLSPTAQKRPSSTSRMNWMSPSM